eukprot:7444833-Alexandrium_andersonii.AAC.1
MPRPRSAKRTAAEASAPASAPEPEVKIAGEPLKVEDLGGNGDCGYRVISCLFAVAAGQHPMSYFTDKTRAKSEP